MLTADIRYINKIEFYENCIKNPEKQFVIFGYASLITVPHIKYSNRKIGCIKNYATRLYQGSIVLGSPEWPGRVATLVPSDGNLCFGVAFYVDDEAKIESWEYLNLREVNYSLMSVDFYPLMNDNTEMSKESETVVTFVALSDNEQYLGECELELQAYQISKAKNKWPNTLYVDNLLTFYGKIPQSLQTDNYLVHLRELIEKISRNEIILSEKQLEELPKRY